MNKREEEILQASGIIRMLQNCERMNGRNASKMNILSDYS
jgi:hypothetical protein